MEAAIKRIIVVGGGTAGWLTAARLAFDHCANKDDGLSVTLIESPDIKPIGVGEGSWPTLRVTLRELGISELEFIAECEVSFKQGSKFVGWRSGLDSDSYYHPFTPPEGAASINVAQAWLKHAGQQPFAYAVSAQAEVCDLGLAPKQIQTPDYAAVLNYGYHLNADKFGKFLQKHCTEKLGVRYIQDNVSDVRTSSDGYIESLDCETTGEQKAGLFIDCTGAAAILIDKHYKAPFVDKSHILFNDTALAVQVPYSDPKQNISSVTLSTAQKHGWIWDIGLPSRRGVGYVYSSDHTDEAAVEQALKRYLSLTVPQCYLKELKPRKLKFKPGYRSKPWLKNCVAVGMSAGFVEPLEASAIAMIELCSKAISEELPADRLSMEIVAERFNARFVERWERVVDFLKLHYLLSERSDSDYWRKNRDMATVPAHLSGLLTLWRNQVPSSADFYQIMELFGPPSYQYVLYGMGYTPRCRETASRWEEDAIVKKIYQDVKNISKKVLSGLPTNRALLDQIQKKHKEKI